MVLMTFSGQMIQLVIFFLHFSQTILLFHEFLLLFQEVRFLSEKKQTMAL